MKKKKKQKLIISYYMATILSHLNLRIRKNEEIGGGKLPIKLIFLNYFIKLINYMILVNIDEFDTFEATTTKTINKFRYLMLDWI